MPAKLVIGWGVVAAGHNFRRLLAWLRLLLLRILTVLSLPAHPPRGPLALTELSLLGAGRWGEHLARTKPINRFDILYFSWGRELLYRF
jgi:hypothetical protein